MSEETLALLEAYLNNELDADAKAAFEQRLAKEPELAKELQLRQEVNQTVANQKALDFMAAVKQAETKYFAGQQAQQDDRKGAGQEQGREALGSGQPKVVRLRVWRPMAAVVALLVLAAAAILLLVVLPGPEQDTRPLFAQLHTPYEAPANYRAQLTAGGYPADLKNGFDYYSQGRYQDALNELVAWQQDSLYGTVATFYIGQAYLALDQPVLALQRLEPVANTPQQTFEAPAQWYVALAYVKQKNWAKARSQFEMLAQQENGPYAAQAKAALQLLPTP